MPCFFFFPQFHCSHSQQIEKSKTIVGTAARSLGGAIRLELATVADDDGLGGVAILAADGLDRLDNIKALDDGAKDNVSAVEPLGLGSAEEELEAGGWKKKA